MKDKASKAIKDSIEVKEKLLRSGVEPIAGAAKMIISAVKGGNKVLIFGNGGSAADSQHMASELIGRFKLERPAIPAIALTANTSTLTALSNDYGYEASFARQLEALAIKGDVVIAISTSGNSANVLSALKAAKKLGLKAITMTGTDGGKIAKLADVALKVPSKDTPRIQESHITAIHIICELVETELHG